MTRRRRREKRKKRRREQRQRRGQTGMTKLRVMPDLLGGLGNQLFVFAACFWYAREHGGTVVLDKAQMKIRSYGAPRPSYADTVFRGFPGAGRMAFQNVPQASVWKAPPSPSVRLTKGYYQDKRSVRRLLQVRDELVAKLSIPGLDVPAKDDRELAVHVRMRDASTPGAWEPSQAELAEARRMVESEVADGVRVTVFSNRLARAAELFPDTHVPAGKSELADLAELASFSRILSVSPSTYLVWSVLIRDHPREVRVPFEVPARGKSTGAVIRRQHFAQLREIPWSKLSCRDGSNRRGSGDG